MKLTNTIGICLGLFMLGALVWQTFEKQAAQASGTSLVCAARSEGDETKPPAVKNPRATSGDTASEPNWAEKLVITVGPKDADINGGTDKAIQAGVDYVARLGGGTVKILPGTYRLRNSIFLASKVRLLGSGWDNTILFKEPSVTTRLAADSDWYDQEITLEDATGFQVGDGICLKGKGAGQVEHYVKRTLVARNGKRFKLDRALRENFWQLNGAVAMSVFPLVTGENLSDLAIENLMLDGNKANNANLNGNYGGCIFLQDCSRVVMRRIIASNYNGDGISWQICHDVLVENCTSMNNTQLGLHPGSGSQRPIIRDNRLVGNDIGIFFCWGVKHGLAEKNSIEGNRLGISIGHRDTDNLITNNTISGSKVAGILFRPERGKDFAGHRNRIVKNKLTDNGGPKDAAIDIQGATEEINILGNEITETRAPAERVAVRMGQDTRDIVLKGNLIRGFSRETGK